MKVVDLGELIINGEHFPEEELHEDSFSAEYLKFSRDALALVTGSGTDLIVVVGGDHSSAFPFYSVP